MNPGGGGREVEEVKGLEGEEEETGVKDEGKEDEEKLREERKTEGPPWWSLS